LKKNTGLSPWTNQRDSCSGRTSSGLVLQLLCWYGSNAKIIMSPNRA
jgi:hypothetical protein